MLFVGRELADVGDDILEEGLAGLGAVAEQGLDQASFAVFVTGFVEGFGDAVGIENEGVAGMDGYLAKFAVPGLPLTTPDELGGPITAWCTDTCLNAYFNKPGTPGGL